MANTSLFALLFIQLQDHIKTECPDIRWIDQDLGQLEFYEIRPPVSWPCCLIDFSQTTYEQQQQDRLQGNLTFTLRLGFDVWSPSASTAPVDVREKALMMYDIEQNLYKAIQGFNAGGLMQDCSLINIATERRDGDSFRVRVLTFTSTTDDSTAQKIWTKVHLNGLDIEPSIS
jgi:hypothetical protein